MSTARITGIYIYPVKSMKGIALERAMVSGTGFEYDRRWMIVRPNGRFVTQRDTPQLSLLCTSLDRDGLVLSRPGHGSITVPYELREGDQIRTKVWNDICETVDQGESISNWLTQALGSEDPLRLVRLKPGFRRTLSKSALMSNETTTEFADGAPLLIANEASLDRLNSVLKTNAHDAVPMNRFRPNIVLRGLEPFAEHGLGTLSTESYQLKLCFPCQRCVVATINQNTAEKDLEGQPLKTLQMINPMPDNQKAPAFGENAILTYGENKYIAVGDNLDILTN